MREHEVRGARRAVWTPHSSDSDDGNENKGVRVRDREVGPLHEIYVLMRWEMRWQGMVRGMRLRTQPRAYDSIGLE